MTIYLVCEGPKGSLDESVINALVIQRFGLNVTVEPAGSDSQLGTIATWLVTRKQATKAYTIEDRNYRSLSESTDSWRSGSTHFIWHRHEIENYLLDPRVVAHAFSLLRATVPKWPTVLPTAAAEIESWLKTLGRSLLENHAGQLLCDSLKQLQCGVLFHPKQSSCDRATWLARLIEATQRAQRVSNEFVTHPEFTPAAIESKYDNIFASLSAPDFFISGRYLQELSGKDLESAVVSYINRQNFPLSKADLEVD